MGKRPSPSLMFVNYCFMCMGVYSEYLPVFSVHAWGLYRSQKMVLVPRKRVKEGCETDYKVSRLVMELSVRTFALYE